MTNTTTSKASETGINMRPITLYHQVPAGIVQTAFSFEKSALRCARDEGYSRFVIAINGRILHSHNVSDPYAFIRG